MADDQQITIQRTVNSVDDLESAMNDLNPILKAIIAVKATTAQPFALPKHIQASFSLSG